MASRDRRKKPEDLKVDAKTHEHLKRIAPPKGGRSRNPNGRPPIPEILRTRAADMSEGALERIEWLAINSPNEMVRFRCNELILSYNLSKAPQEQRVEMNVNVGFGDFLARANKRRRIIEVQAEEVVTLAAPHTNEDEGDQQ